MTARARLVRPARLALATALAVATLLLLAAADAKAVPTTDHVEINSPPSIAGSYQSGTAVFGPQTFDTTADVVLVDDGSTAGTGGTVNDACQTPFVSSVAGKIAFADRGTCTFETKALNAQNEGAVGLIVGNVASSANPTVAPGMADDPTITTPITIGTLSVNQADGTTIKTALASDTVNATLYRNLAQCGDPFAITDTNNDNRINGADSPPPTTGDDYIQGDDSAETIAGFGGDDLICGGDGGDFIYPGSGNDDAFGEAGNDGFNSLAHDLAVGAGGTIAPDPGADEYDGGPGSDRLFYDADGDTVNNTVTPGDGANDGDPTANAGAGEGDDVKDSTEHVDFGAGNDTFGDPVVGADNTVRGAGGADSFEGGAGKDLLLGQAGEDTELDGGDDNDKVNGGSGNDLEIEGGLGADLLYGEAGNDLLEGYGYYGALVDGNDTIYGGSGNDTLRGDEGNDRLYGDADADDLDGEDGHDSLFGGDAADDLVGGGGNDSLVPGPDSAADTMQGGADTDTATYSNDPDDIYASIGDGANDGTDPDGPSGAGDGSAEGDDIMGDVENIATGGGNDTLIGDGDVNRLTGNAGEDTISGRDARDVLIGNTDNDFLIGNDDGGTPKADSLQCDGDSGSAPFDRYLRDAIDSISQCETNAAPPT